MEGFKPSHVWAGKGYDGDDILQTIAAMNAVPVIPPRSYRRRQQDYDLTIYKQRNIVEHTFNKLWRRLATGYDRKAIYFAAFVYLAAATLWL